MRKSIILGVLLAVVSLGMAAQENIHFVAGMPTQKGLSEKVAGALKLKVEQILARNNAGATSLYNAFVIQPELVIGETRKTEGLVRDVTLVTGEFSLTARNIYDDSVYGTVVIEVQGDAVGKKEAAMASLISSIKVTDPAFVRFIRNSRKHIAEYYEQNCPAILKKAQALMRMEKMEEAADYLSVVPETVPCYDEVLALLEKLPQRVPAVPEVVTKDTIPAIPLVPALQPVPAVPVVEQPEPELPEYQIAISCNDLAFELVSCEGNETAQAIRIHARFTNKGVSKDGATIHLTSAIDPEGATYTDFSQIKTNGCTTYMYGNKMPKGVKVGKVFEIGKVDAPCTYLSYVEIAVDNCKVIIHNLPVVWK